MTQIDLKEYAPADYALSAAEHYALRREASTLGLSIEPVLDSDGSYRLTAGPTVGAVEIADLSVLIEPKIGIPQLLSLACYAMRVFKPQEKRLFDFEEREALPDTLAIALASAARGAFVRGLLHGYREEEEALQTVRGRIRIEDQMRRRLGFALAVEVRYDEFTDDILANRLVKAAVTRLSGMPLRSPEARRGLGWVAAMLEQVSHVEFGPNDVPEVRFDRLNEHYRGVVGLSRLVLRYNAFESGRGSVRASGFLMDMNVVFQEFVTVALREALGVSEQTLRSDRGLPRVTLDEDKALRLEPDLSWWDGTTCTFVGDAKYKNLTGARAPTPTCTSCLPTPPRWTSPAVSWCTRRVRRTLCRTAFGTQASVWTSSLSTSPARLRMCSGGSTTWPRGCGSCVMRCCRAGAQRSPEG